VLDFGFSCTMYMYYFSKLLTSTVYACCVLWKKFEDHVTWKIIFIFLFIDAL
jgi:hypothetical protein